MSRPLPSRTLRPARHAGRLALLVLQQGCSSRVLDAGSSAAGASRACAVSAVIALALGACLRDCEACMYNENQMSLAGSHQCV